MDVNTLGCCAVRELDGISGKDSPVEVLDALIREEGDDAPAFYLFTQARRGKGLSGYGWDLGNFILKQGLGRILISTPLKNPASLNHVTVFLWEIDQVRWRRYVKVRGKEMGKED